MDNFQKRQIAYKSQIKSLLEGRYISQDGYMPSYLIDEYGREVSRVNLIATTVTDVENDGSSQAMMIDDGTGRIQMRSFQNSIPELGVGEIVLVIGKVRDFNDERYILPEIVKPIDDQRWIEVRKKELEMIEPEAQEDVDISPVDYVYNLIKENDPGSGADIEELLQKSDKEDTEKIINNLLQDGEIFEISPGKYKVLE